MPHARASKRSQAVVAQEPKRKPFGVLTGPAEVEGIWSISTLRVRAHA